MKNAIISSIITLLFINGLISCDQTFDSTENKLIGIWNNTKIDTLVQYITPIKPDTIISSDCNNCVLVINKDNSFKMCNPTDTVIGNWEQSASDTLIFIINDKLGNFINKQNLKIENNTLTELVLINFGGYISGAHYAGHSGFSVTEEIKYRIKMYYNKTE